MSSAASKTLKAVMRTTPLKCSLYEWHLNTGHGKKALQVALK